MRKYSLKIICLFLLSLYFLPTNAGSQTLAYFQTDHRYDYHIELLRFAMEKTLASDGPYSMVPSKIKMTHKRGRAYLEKGIRINIGFFASNKERESKLLPVKIPLLRGLLGYRVFLIRRDSLEVFSNIDSLLQLKDNFKAGFGSQWADMEILRFNNIPVVGVAKYENLFNMLIKKRFDYFPRGVNEAWNEIAQRKQSHPGLFVAPDLAFYYPYPVYFFVHKKNTALAGRLERGLNAALSDGTFKKLFLSYHLDLIQMANLKSRKIFILKNPTLAQNTLEPDTGWWKYKKE